MENPIKMDVLGGTTIFGNIHIHAGFLNHQHINTPPNQLQRTSTRLPPAIRGSSTLADRLAKAMVDFFPPGNGRGQKNTPNNKNQDEMWMILLERCDFLLLEFKVAENTRLFLGHFLGFVGENHCMYFCLFLFQLKLLCHWFFICFEVCFVVELGFGQTIWGSKFLPSERWLESNINGGIRICQHLLVASGSA